MAWLEGVSQHPIFASTSSDTRTKGKSQRVALVRNSELLVARGRELRIANLIDSKSRHDAGNSQAQTYKTVVAPALDFEIRSLAVNPTSKLVAVIGDKRAAVVVLPRKGWNLVVGTTLELNALRIDATRYNDQGTRIVQARWYHWSKDGTTLLMMTEDGYVREYDVGIDSDEPQETLDLRPSFANPSETTFDVDEDGDVACSFCLGAGTGWGALTVYALFADGTITSACPYAAKNADIPLHILEVLVESAQAEIDDLSNQPLTYSTEEKQRCAQADALLHFVSGLLRRAQTASGEMNGYRVLEKASTKFRLRGPYLLQPAPRQLRDVQDSSACDIIASTASPSSAVVILLVAHNDGRVNVFLDLLANASSLGLPTLVTFETVDLGTSSLQGSALPQLLPDAAARTTIHLHHAHGLHTVELPASLAALLLDLSRDSTAWREALASATGSEVRWHARTSEPVTGSANVSDVYLGHTLIAQLQNGRGFAVDVGKKVDEELAQSPPTAATQKSGYVSVLREPTFAPPQIKLSPRPAISGPSGTASTTTLQEMGKIIEGMRHDIRAIVDATNATQDRLRRQLAELPRQVAKLQEIQQRVDRSLGQNGGDRLATISDAQQKLLLRTDRLLQRLMQAHSPGVSDAERAWFAELARLRGELERGLGRRVTKLNETVAALRPRVQAYAEEPKGEGRLGERQVRAVEAQLLSESRLIDAAKFKVETLNARFAAAA